jgi:hypothetical protein
MLLYSNNLSPKHILFCRDPIYCVRDLSLVHHLLACRDPSADHGDGRKQALRSRLVGGGRLLPLARFLFLRARSLADQKGSERHPGQDATVLDPGFLGQSVVGFVRMQADRPLLSVKAANCAEPI